MVSFPKLDVPNKVEKETSSGNFRQTVKINMKHTNLYNEIEMQEPKDHSNFYVGLAVGVMVTVCTIIYGVMSVIS